MRFGWRLEIALLAAFSAVWLLAVLALFGILPLAGVFDLGLYRLYSVAAALGWLAGNVYLLRGRGLPAGGRGRRRLLLAYLLGPPGVLYLLRSLAPPAVQAGAPLVPLLSFAVYLLFFLVPVTLRPRPSRR
ncbi:MAG TPA: hypothetical protein VGG06_36740 [Thermoanaerobaculia bacterium]